MEMDPTKAEQQQTTASSSTSNSGEDDGIQEPAKILVICTIKAQMIELHRLGLIDVTSIADQIAKIEHPFTRAGIEEAIIDIKALQHLPAAAQQQQMQRLVDRLLPPSLKNSMIEGIAECLTEKIAVQHLPEEAQQQQMRQLAQSSMTTAIAIANSAKWHRGTPPSDKQQGGETAECRIDATCTVATKLTCKQKRKLYNKQKRDRQKKNRAAGKAAKAEDAGKAATEVDHQLQQASTSAESNNDK